MLEGESRETQKGMNSVRDWTVAEHSKVEHFHWIHQAALAKWGSRKNVSFEDIEKWVRDGAPGPDGQRTIAMKSASKPGASLSLFGRGRVFEDAGIK